MDRGEWYWYSTCHDIGIGGGCGEGCPVLDRGDCEVADEIRVIMDEPARKNRPATAKELAIDEMDRIMNITRNMCR